PSHGIRSNAKYSLVHFFFSVPAMTEFDALSLHDALPILIALEKLAILKDATLDFEHMSRLVPQLNALFLLGLLSRQYFQKQSLYLTPFHSRLDGLRANSMHLG